MTIRTNPGGGEIFNAVHIGCEAHSASCLMDTLSFPRVSQPERGAVHPPPCE
jgi:hypothetical protein